jgi:ABC-type transporter Mla subunit MlaD
MDVPIGKRYPMSNPLSALAAEAHKLGADAVAVFHHDAAKIEAAVTANVAATKADLEKAIASLPPEIQSAVQNAINAMEKAALDALV